MLDHLILIIFVLFLGYVSYKSLFKIEGINSFSLGTRAFSTKALTATIAATWVSGSGFILDINEFHKKGISYFIEASAMCITLSVVALVIVPRMKKYLGKLSVAQIMGEEYGQKVRFITAILGVASASGGIYVQFKVMGITLNHLFEFIPVFYCTVISAAIVIFYSYLGGITAVVTTDKIQAICFILSLVIGIVIFKMTIQDNIQLSSEQYAHFYPSHIMDFNFKQQYDFVSLFLYFCIPSMAPHVVQRVCMGGSIKQVQKAYLWSALVLFIVLVISCYYSFLLFQVNPNIPKNEALPYLLSLYSIDGTRAILIIGIICMCMSTADSQLNIASILVGNDIIRPNKATALQKLHYARYSTILIGTLSLLFTFKQGSLLDIIIFILSFYMPIITPPFLLAIFNKKVSEKHCLVGMFTTFIFVAVFKIFIDTDLVIIPIAILLNVLLLCTKPVYINRIFNIDN